MLLEYKFFEPAFYYDRHAGLGHVAAHCLALGDQALGRASTPATTRPAPTSSSSSRCCCGLGRLGAFDFNSRFYADDDLMVGAADPFQLFRIMHEIVRRRRAGAGRRASTSCSTSATTSSRRSPGRSARCMNVQEATAKALLVDATRCAAAQTAGDVLGANGVLMDAYNTDVRPLLARAARATRGSTPTRSAATSRRVRREDRRRARRRRPGGLGSMMTNSRRAGRPVATGSGADPRNTNYAGGNTSAKGTETDPVTGSRSSWCGSRVPAATWAR